MATSAALDKELRATLRRYLARAEDSLLPEIKDLLGKGADPNGEDADGSTSLMLAVRSKNADICHLLLDNGCGLNEGPQWGGLSPLSYAIKNGSFEICKVFIERGADTKRKDDDGTLPMLHAICAEKNVDICKLLLSKRADMRCYYGSSMTGLEVAAGFGDKPLAAVFLEHGNDINIGRALLDAAAFGRLKICELLLQKGADVMVRGLGRAETTLHKAAEGGHLDVCYLLMKHGVAVDALDVDGKSALDYAKHPGVISVLKEIMQKRTDQTSDQPHNKRKRDGLPVHLALSSEGVTSLIEELVDERARAAAAEKDKSKFKRELGLTKASLDAVCSHGEKERQEGKAILLRLQQEKTLAETCLKVESSERRSEKRAYAVTLAQLDQERLTAQGNLEELELRHDEAQTMVRRLQQEKAAAESNLGEECRRFDLNVKRLEEEKLAAETKLAGECRDRKRERSEFEAVMKAAEDSFVSECEKMDSERRDFELNTKRLEEDKVALEQKLEEESRQWKRERSEFDAFVEASEAERRDTNQKMLDSQMTIAQLQQEKVALEQKLQTSEVKKGEFRMIAKQLEKENVAAHEKFHGVLKTQIVIKQEPHV